MTPCTSAEPDTTALTLRLPRQDQPRLSRTHGGHDRGARPGCAARRPPARPRRADARPRARPARVTPARDVGRRGRGRGGRRVGDGDLRRPRGAVCCASCAWTAPPTSARRSWSAAARAATSPTASSPSATSGAARRGSCGTCCARFRRDRAARVLRGAGRGAARGRGRQAVSRHEPRAHGARCAAGGSAARRGDCRAAARVVAVSAETAEESFTVERRRTARIVRAAARGAGDRRALAAKSGSDGVGLWAGAALGHTLVPTTPALAPLVLTGTGTRRWPAVASRRR